MTLLKVLTLNIWNRQGPWEDRLELLRAGMKRLDADVVGLQEVIDIQGRTQAHHIFEGLPHQIAFGPAHDLGEGVRFGNAIASRWPIEATKVFKLPNGPTKESRSVVLAWIQAPFGRLPFLSTHFNWKFHEGFVREQQAREVAAIVKREVPIHGSLPPVLVGDFNAQPDASEMRFLRGLQSLEGTSTFFGDCFDQVGAGPGFTYDARNNPFAGPTNEYPRRIDYIYVRGPTHDGKGKPVRAEVVFDEVVGGICATDHYGVLAEIEM